MKIGFFDSGMGGLFMMQSCIEEYRNHEYVYAGDTKNLPYGPRDSVEIFELMSPYILWLFNEHKCDYVVLACNTASAQSLDMLIQKYPEYKKRLINIVTLTQSYINSEIKDPQQLLVLATERTVKSEVYQTSNTQQLAMPGLVDLIESGDREASRTTIVDALLHYSGVDYVLLGCTHYADLIKTLSDAYPEITFIAQDSIINIWISKLKDETKNLAPEYYVSGDPYDYEKVFDIPIQRIVLKKPRRNP